MSDDAFVTAQAKANEALDAREREVDGLSNVVKHLTKEMENLTLEKQQELKDKIAELNSQHEAQVKDTLEKANKIAQDANEKIETLTKRHQAQLEQGSGALAVQLREVKEAAETREADLLEQIRIEKKAAAEAIEVARESAAESIEVIKKQSEVLQKEFEGKLEGFQSEATKTTDENHKELESKIGQLKSLYEEQINALTTKSDKSETKLEELLKDIEVTKREVDEGRAALEQREIEAQVLKGTLDTLSSDLIVCPPLENCKWAAGLLTKVAGERNPGR